MIGAKYGLPRNMSQTMAPSLQPLFSMYFSIDSKFTYLGANLLKRATFRPAPFDSWSHEQNTSL